MHCCGQRLAHVPQPIQTSVMKKSFSVTEAFSSARLSQQMGLCPRSKNSMRPSAITKASRYNAYPRIDLIQQRILFKNTVNHRVLFHICKPLGTPHKVYRLPLVIQSCYSNDRIRQKLLTEILATCRAKKEMPLLLQHHINDPHCGQTISIKRCKGADPYAAQQFQTFLALDIIRASPSCQI